MDTTKEIVLTPEGRQKLVDELAYREGEKHDEIVERIKEARGFGDLSENSEYDAAKEEQSHNESRINEIRQILSVAKVIEGGSKRKVTVAIGTTVELADAKGKTTKYVIVGTTETNSLEHKISNESPATAKARGIKTGDVVRIYNDRGEILCGALVSDTAQDNVVIVSEGAWYDPALWGEKSLCKHGNINVLTKDVPSSQLSQSNTAHTSMAQIEKYKGELPSITAFDRPATIEA